MSTPQLQGTVDTRVKGRAIVVLGSILLLSVTLISCKKEAVVVEEPDAGIADLGKRFRPEPAAIVPEVDSYKHLRALHQSGAKSDGEKPLQEALWLNEALMNFEKGDATRIGLDWVNGTYTYTVPVHAKSDGSFWVYNDDLLDSYELAIAEVNAQVGEGKVYMVDHEIVSVGDGVATLVLTWHDKADDEPESNESRLDGSGYGCVNPEEAVAIFNRLIKANYLIGVQPGEVVVSIFTFGTYTNDIVGYRVDGYPYYVGTSDNLGGPHWLYSGPFLNQVCFPDRWHRFVELRQWASEVWNLRSHELFIRERVDANYYQRTGGPFTYGSPYYPMGPWDHRWFWTIGTMVQNS